MNQVLVGNAPKTTDSSFHSRPLMDTLAPQVLLQDYFNWVDVSEDEEDLAVRWAFSGHSIFDNPWGFVFEQGRRQDFVSALRSYWIVANATVQRLGLDPFLATEELIAKCEPDDEF